MRRTILQLEFEQLALLMGLPPDTKIRLVESRNSIDQVHFVLEGRRMLEHGPGSTAIVICRPNPAPSAAELEENIRIALNLQNGWEEQEDGQGEIDGDDDNDDGNMTEEEFLRRTQQDAQRMRDLDVIRAIDGVVGNTGVTTTVTATVDGITAVSDVRLEGEADGSSGVLRGSPRLHDQAVGEDRTVRGNGVSSGEDQLWDNELRVRHEAREEVPDLHERMVRGGGSEEVRPEVVRRTRRGLLPHSTQQLRPRRVFRILRNPS